MIEWIVFIGSIIILVGAIGGIAIWICKATDPCKHSYERVDTANDKKMILVCRRCGKIKKIRK
jgi:hypothetical protein